MRTYTEVGIHAHHPLSHHEYKPETIALISKVSAHHGSMFRRLLGEPPRDAGRRRARCSTTCCSSTGCGMPDSNATARSTCPSCCSAGAPDRSKADCHIRNEDDPLMPNLMNRLGVPVERLGESDGRLSGAADGDVGRSASAAR